MNNPNILKMKISNDYYKKLDKGDGMRDKTTSVYI